MSVECGIIDILIWTSVLTNKKRVGRTSFLQEKKMIKKTLRKAFTIVELVIVIAVIGILSAVLIPTFSGLIESGNLRADESEITAINTKLAMDDVATSKDIYDIIEKTYSKGKAENFAPRSVKYGKYYFYDTQTNKAILSSFDDLEESSDEINADFGVSTYSISSAKGNSNFAKNYANDYRMFKGRYFLLDNSGSVIGNVVGAMTNGTIKQKTTGEENVVDLLVNAANENKNADEKAMASALLENVQTKVISNENITYVYDQKTVESFSFEYGMEKVSSNIVVQSEDFETDDNAGYVYVMSGNQNVVVKVPETVTNVQSGSLWFGGEAKENVTIEISKSSTQVKEQEIVKAAATNVSIKTNENEVDVTVNITLNEDKLTITTTVTVEGEENSTVVNVEVDYDYAWTVTNFTIGCSEVIDNNKYSFSVGALNLACGETTTLSAVDFEGVPNFDNYKGVTWRSDNESIATIDENGNVTAVSKGEVKIFATAKIGGLEKEITVNVVTPTFDITIDESNHNEYKLDGGLLYLLHTIEGGKAILKANNFRSELGFAFAEGVKWESNNTALSIDENTGAITVNRVFATATITATAEVGGETKTIEVGLITPTSFTFNLNGTTRSSNLDKKEDKTIEIVYTESDEFDLNNFVATYNYNVGVYGSENVTVVTTGNLFTITGSEGNYKLKLIDGADFENGTQDFTVTVGLISETFEIKINDQSATPFEIDERYKTSEMLYRVGNGNTFTLDTFFNTEKAGDADLEITVGISGDSLGTDGITAKVNGASVSSAVAISKDSWESTTVQISGTGVVKLSLGGTSIRLEVVDGNNVLPGGTISVGGNLVLLGDANIVSGGKIEFNGTTLYGNGFTFDVSAGNHSAGNYSTDNYVIYLNNSILNNVRIIGQPFSDFAVTAAEADNVCNVYATGKSIIANSYISGCAAPVRANNCELTIIDSTLKGGSYANLDMRNGSLVLENVTTINEVRSAESGEQTGLGIAVWYEQVSSCQITIKGSLTQYNCLSETYVGGLSIGSISGSTLKSAVFASSNNAVIKEIDGTKWTNTGILSLIDTVGTNNIDVSFFNESGNYNSVNVSFTVAGIQKNGYLYSLASANVDPAKEIEDYETAGQYEIMPIYTLNNSSEDKATSVDDKEYCTLVGEEVTVSFEQGGNKVFTVKDFFNPTKFGKAITVTNIYLNNTPITSDTITLSEAGEYTLKFVYDDVYNYGIDGKTITIQREKIIKLTVIAVKPDAKNATFNFNNNGYRVETINGINYVMPNVSATSSTIASKTIDGKTVYLPIVAGFSSTGSNTNLWKDYYMCFPVFSGVVTITDYADGGLGDAVTYDASTTTLPANLYAVNPGTIFQYASSSQAPTTTSVYSSKLVYTSPKCNGVNRDEMSITAEYVYKDNKGTEYHYYVRYDTPAIKGKLF